MAAKSNDERRLCRCKHLLISHLGSIGPLFSLGHSRLNLHRQPSHQEKDSVNTSCFGEIIADVHSNLQTADRKPLSRTSWRKMAHPNRQLAVTSIFWAKIKSKITPWKNFYTFLNMKFKDVSQTFQAQFPKIQGSTWHSFRNGFRSITVTTLRIFLMRTSRFYSSSLTTV